MLKIIKPRERKVRIEYFREFLWRDRSRGGFLFPSDKDGNVDLSTLNPAAVENYKNCLDESKDGKYDVVDAGVKVFRETYVEPAEAECLCGHIIQLASFTNTCVNCNRDYNLFGQQLAPRSQWGEETGETAGEILNIGHTIS